MAQIPTIDGQQIGPSNAYKFYYDYKHGKRDLTPEQANYCKHYLSSDQISYCEESSADAQVDGEDRIDAEAMGDGKGRGGTKSSNKVMSYTGVAASAISAGAILVAIAVDGFSQLAIAIIVAACAALNVASALMLDGAYEDRCKQGEASEANNQELINQCQKVQEAIERVRSDKDMYNNAQRERTDIVNDGNNKQADLEIQLQTAEKDGDVVRANEIKAKMNENVDKHDTTGQDETISYCREDANAAELVLAEATGATNKGLTVAEYLEEAEPFGKIAKYQTTANSILAAASTAAALGTFPKFLAIDSVPSTAGKILFFASALMFMYASMEYGSKQTKEEENTTNGNMMHDQCKTNKGSIADLNEQINSAYKFYDSVDATSRVVLGNEPNSGNPPAGNDTPPSPTGGAFNNGNTPYDPNDPNNPENDPLLHSN